MNRDAFDPVLVIGAGIMGSGIAQIAAQAGHDVMLFDARDGAAEAAVRKLAAAFDTLVVKGRLTADAAHAASNRISAIVTLEAAASVRLVVEAIVENLDVKRSLLKQLEAIVDPDCVLASNTSSISITALSNGLRHPGRLVGMHFFDPVPLMKLVEVVSGLRTSRDTAEKVFLLGQRWGKVAVHARSTPGFIVNRIARPFYAETLALLLEQAAAPGVLDDCLRGAGFRMGACELMDLIGHDTNLAVTRSVHEANFGDKRFGPSLVQQELVDGGMLGRKSGQGFFAYPMHEAVTPAAPASGLPAGDHIVVQGHGNAADGWADSLTRAGRPFERALRSPWTGLSVDGAQLRQTDGRPAALLAVQAGCRDVAVFDRVMHERPAGGALAWAAAGNASEHWQAMAPQWLAALEARPQRISDTPALVVSRTIAMLINEAADAVLQGVCSCDAADAAMKLGVNYPAGPFEWLAAWNASEVVDVLDRLDAQYRGERYRASPGLRQRAWACGEPASES